MIRRRKEIKKILALGFKEPGEVSLLLGPDSRLYGLAKEALFLIDPKNDQISAVAKPTAPIDSGMAILGRKIYFGSGATLWEFEIPLRAREAGRVEFFPSCIQLNLVITLF